MTQPVDLTALDAFLMSERAPANGMGLSDLDGFLTGLLVGPELIMPSEWLPAVWGGEPPVFDRQDEAQAILSAIMGRYNEIARALQDDDPASLDPIFWEGPDGSVVASDWAEGFMEALDLRPAAWMPLLRDRRAGILLMPILALCGDEQGEPALPIEPDEADVLDEAPDLIPVSVVGIRQFWQDHLARGTQPAPPRRVAKPGRNDPCPCGSGRKHKRCCGAH